MKITVSILALCIVFASCGKEKFTTAPQLEVKDVSSTIIPRNGDLSVRLEFRDKEGDVSDSLFVIRERLNVKDQATKPYVIKYKIPVFPNKSSGEFQVDLAYNFALTLQLSPIRIPGTSENEPDTLRLKFVATDLQKNVSDTAVINRVIVMR